MFYGPEQLRPRMNRESTTFGLSVVGIVIGLIILLAGEYAHVRTVVYGGATVMLAAVSLIAYGVTRL